MKIKPIILMLVFLMSYVLIAIPYSENVNATSVIYTEGFEGGVAGTQLTLSQSISGMIETKKYSSQFNVSSAYARTGSKGFICGAGATASSGWMNFSYSKSSYLTKFNTYFYCWNTMVNYIYFYNNTNQGYKIGVVNASWDRSIVMIQLNGATDRAYYYDELGNAIEICALPDSVWRNFYWSVSDTTGLFSYYCNSVYKNSSSCCKPSAIANNWRIDRVIMKSTVSTYGLRLDDFNFTISSTYETGGGTTPSDFSQYRTLGSLPTQELSFGGNYPVIEQRYENDFSGVIYGIDIPNFNTVPTNWKLGFNVGINGMTYTPDLMYNVSIYGVSDILHIYRFDFSSTPLTVDSEKLLIEFYSALTTPSGYYYYPSLSSSDVDLDGVRVSKRGDTSYFDGDYNGQLIDNNHEFCYLLYYEGAMGEIPEEETTYNFLSVYGGRYTNTSGQPLFYKNDTVSMGWGVSDMTVSNIIRIKYAGVNITLQGFPYTLYSPKGAIAYCPENNGNYTVYLYVNSVKTITKYFDVISNPNTEENAYQIHSLPPSTYDYTQYTVKYNYINPVGYEGRIALFKNYYDVSNYTRNVYNRTIDSNTTGGQFLYLPIDLEKNDYWQLFVKVGSSFIPKGNYHVHYLMKSGLSSYMSIDYGQRFGDTAKIGVPITVTGYHPYILQNVNVFVNGLPIQYVGTTQSFSFTYTPVKKGTHIFELSVRLDNGTNYILATDECIVYESNETDGGGGGIVPSGWKIDPPFSYFFGIAIIILTTLSPLIVIKGVNRDFNLSTIPQFLYLIMGVIGFIISIVLGFFPAWSLLVLVVIAVLILAILWLKGNSNQVG